MMDLTDEIDEFLKGKGISDGTARTQKSVLLTFNKWLVLMPHKDIREAGRAYRSALDERTGLKPKTVRTQASLVEDFCEWEASRLEGKPQNLLKPTKQRTASSRELERICRAAVAQGGIGKRNASMALLSITCGLSAEDIASLLFNDVTFPLGTTGTVYRGGFTIPMPRITTDMLWLYRGTGRYSVYAFFFPMPSDERSPMRPCDVRRCIDDILDRAGVGSCVLPQDGVSETIRCCMKSLDGAKAKAISSFARSVCYSEERFQPALLRKEVEAAARPAPAAS